MPTMRLDMVSERESDTGNVRFVQKPVLESSAQAIKEEWRPLSTYPTHEVNNMGEVRRIGELLPCPWWWDNRGYRRVSMWAGRIQKLRPIHKLVAEAFLPPQPSPKHSINHIDGIKDNNWATNLEWATIQEQADHAMRLGLWDGARSQGEKNGQAKLTESQVREIRSLQGTMRHADIAAKFGVSKTMVQHINTGKAWKHVI